MFQTFASDGERNSVLLPQLGLQRPCAETCGLPARITAESGNLLYIQAVTSNGFIVGDVFRFRTVTVVFVHILNVYGSMNRLQRRTGIRKQAVFNVGIVVLRYGVGISVHDDGHLLSVPKRQSGKHASQIQ